MYITEDSNDAIIDNTDILVKSIMWKFCRSPTFLWYLNTIIVFSQQDQLSMSS